MTSSQNLILTRVGGVRLVAACADGMTDILDAAKKWRLWWHLARLDIRARYRRTVIGPMWTTLSAAVLVASLGMVYSILWRVEPRIYLPYFAAGYSTWLFFTTAINEGAIAFSSNQPIINSVRLPLSLHIFRLIARNILIFLHIVIVYIGVMLWFHIMPNFTALLVLPFNFLLFVLNLFWLGLLLATVCSRYRDINQVVTNFIQIAYFITPIFWQADLLNARPGVKFLLADLNPIYHLIELIRAPLLGNVPSLLTYGMMAGTALIGFGLSVNIFSRYRGRIAFWL